MTRYRTRPREVEAVQWFKDGDHPDVREYSPRPFGYITNVGMVHPTDWIVTDATGNRIVRAADFAEQIEEIGDDA